MSDLREILDLVAVECERQDAKHGPFEGGRLGRSRLALACIRDELDEAERAWRDERTGVVWAKARVEVIQVAAVAVRAVRDAFGVGVEWNLPGKSNELRSLVVEAIGVIEDLVDREEYFGAREDDAALSARIDALREAIS